MNVSKTEIFMQPQALQQVSGPDPHAREKRRRHDRARGLAAIYQSCASALQALRSNKLRSLLTSLGIIIGVGAVILVISIGESSAASINQRLSGLSPNELIVRPGSASSGGVRQGAGTLSTLTQADADAISSQVANVAAVSPVVNVSGGQVIFRNQNWSTTVQGVYPDYQQIGSWQLQEGSFFQSADEQGVGAVAVVGQTVVDNLFTPLGVDPIGQQNSHPQSVIYRRRRPCFQGGRRGLRQRRRCHLCPLQHRAAAAHRHYECELHRRDDEQHLPGEQRAERHPAAAAATP